MIDSTQLLDTLKPQLNRLLADLRERVDTVDEIGDPLRSEYQLAFDAGRTGWTFTEWAEDRLTQIAVGWVLAGVFVRFCEDNGLLPDARIAGVDRRGDEARAAQQDFFRANPHASDRDYLHDVFRAAAAAPGLSGVLGEGTNPLWLTDPSADACSELISMFRATRDDGTLTLDFTDAARDTRFLGDLYQDLSEHAKKTYALLQTPVFVEEFILDRTLDPAIEAFGLADTSLIDPTCGSGHFLLGGFDRLFERWADAEPASDPAERTQRALDAVWGVDINPFAAAIARFRLLVAGLRRCDQRRLVDAPDLPIHVAVGDSLLWGAQQQQLPGLEGTGDDRAQFLYATEDSHQLRATFGRTYSAVVGNPPYINPPDKQANTNYRALWDSCHRQYQLGTPFTELFFDLAAAPNPASGTAAGFVGLINSDAFMKREFGRKLIEQFIPQWDLTHVVHTSGAYIPGHGTPTVILFGRNQAPVADTVRSVMGIRGEPTPPADPTKGLVWSAIVTQIDEPGSESDYISVADTERSRFASHPWSIGGGGAAELKLQMDKFDQSMADVQWVIGRTAHTSADDAYFAPAGTWQRSGVPENRIIAIVEGDTVRDWSIADVTESTFPYDSSLQAVLEPDSSVHRLLWLSKQYLVRRREPNGFHHEIGKTWYEWSRFHPERFRTPLSIAFAFVATHNHFVLDRGGKVFKQSAPVIKLPEGATVEDHLGLLALLNSSVACFWMKQTMTCKGNGGIGGGIGDEQWEPRYEFDGTKMQTVPLPDAPRPVDSGRELDELAQQLSAVQPSAVATAGVPTRAALDAASADAEQIEARMVAAQEELDWHCLHLYGLTDEPLTVPDGTEPPPLQLGERAFEIILARQVATGDTETAWFTRHRSTPITELPAHWPEWYRDLVEPPHRADRVRPQRRAGRTAREQAALEPHAVGRPRAGRAARLAVGPARGPFAVVRRRPGRRAQRRPARGPRLDRRRLDQRRLHLEGPVRRRSGRGRRRTGRRRARTRSGRSPLQAVGHGQADRVGTHLGAATRRGPWRGGRTHRGAAQVCVVGLPQAVVLASARQARRAQGAVHLGARRRARRRHR
ncbi:MAG: BREX-2 system adenine-specific DNA-methyltransferase PglX [Microthrixaceae bacterium]|nr:BREX-2 system adenine-specific DNA-methyltransferase PglX [Microthrixaceae bacterium]